MMKKLNIGIYVRISNDDDNEGDSASIIGQEALILSDIKKRFEGIFCETYIFKDDGYSGTNFDRPGINEMFKAVKSGQIDCVMVKDLSRFGRNYIEVGNYLEKVFPYLGVRFIAVNDNYDSDKNKWSSAGLDMPFKNLLYDLYSKDLSRKILSSKKLNREKGKVSYVYAPYGFQKDDDNKNTLKVDEEASEIVKFIFNSILNGKTTGQIAKELNKNNILTPMLHKQSMGISSGFNSKNNTNIWTATSVRVIAKDERYTGKYIAGKQKRRISDDKKTIQIPKEQWVVIENRFPIIISQDVYDMVNEKITKGTCGARKKDDKRLFSKKIRCKCCNLYFRRRDRDTAYYFCSSAKFGNHSCYQGKIYEKDIADTLMKIFTLHLNRTKAIEKVANYQKTVQFNNKKQFAAEMKPIYAKIKQKEYALFGLYEEFSKGKMLKNEYIEQKKCLNAQISALQKNIEKHEKTIKKGEERANKNNDIIETFDAYKSIDNITKELANELIEEIIVCENGMLDIKFSYRNPLKKQDKIMPNNLI